MLKNRIKNVITHNIHELNRARRPVLRLEAFVDDELHARDEQEDGRSLTIVRCIDIVTSNLNVSLGLTRWENNIGLN